MRKQFYCFLQKTFALIITFFLTGLAYNQQVGPSLSNQNNTNSNSQTNANNQNRKLIAGDRLSYAVSEDLYAGLSINPIEIVVQSDGTITIPVQGPRGLEYPLPPFRAAGLTPVELQRNIKAALEKDFYNTATVSLLLVSFGGSIEVMGEVGAPGTINLPPDRRLTITGAIAAAGGFAQYADERRVELRRRKQDGTVEVIRLDVKRIRQTGQGNIEVQHGDEIFVRPVGIIPGL